MSDTIETHSWQVESKSGANTRVDGVAGMRIGDNLERNEDSFELVDASGAPLFVAPFSSISFAKRIEPLGKSASREDVIVGEGVTSGVEAAVRRVLNDSRFRGLA